jgi:hypothetical protein
LWAREEGCPATEEAVEQAITRSELYLIEAVEASAEAAGPPVEAIFVKQGASYALSRAP